MQLSAEQPGIKRIIEYTVSEILILCFCSYSLFQFLHCAQPLIGTLRDTFL